MGVLTNPARVLLRRELLLKRRARWVSQGSFDCGIGPPRGTVPALRMTELGTTVLVQVFLVTGRSREYLRNLCGNC